MQKLLEFWNKKIFYAILIFLKQDYELFMN